MTEQIKEVIEGLRHELQQYGEMLALLEEQQEHLMSRRVDHVVDAVTRIQAHTRVLKRVRMTREDAQQTLARTAGHPECTGLLLLVDFLPEDYRPLMQALVTENNQLLQKVQQRGRQNYLLLSRAVDLMQQFINSLSPGEHTTVYGGTGTVSTHSSSHKIYEAVG
jgi:flagellar biosynthesis/type III secretory pathway chaperone